MQHKGGINKETGSRGRNKNNIRHRYANKKTLVDEQEDVFPVQINITTSKPDSPIRGKEEKGGYFTILQLFKMFHLCF